MLISDGAPVADSRTESLIKHRLFLILKHKETLLNQLRTVFTQHHLQSNFTSRAARKEREFPVTAQGRFRAN